MKVCSKCNIEKNESEFSKNRTKQGGLQNHCKACCTLYKRINVSRFTKHKAAWRAANKDKSRKYENMYRQSYRQINPLFKLACITRSLLCNSFKSKGYKKNSKTAQLIGCGFEEFMAYLGPKPYEDAVIDHICPCSQAKNEDELSRLQHYSNLQWLTASENMSKSDNKTSEGEFMCMLLLHRYWR